MGSYLSKIDVHLEVEKKILEAWNYKDKAENRAKEKIKTPKAEASKQEENKHKNIIEV